MLPQANRLRNTKDIEMVFKKGRGVKEGFLFLKFLENNLKVSRFAFIVSRKTARKAVQRNKIKRTLRDIIHKNLLQINIGFDFVIIAQGVAVSASFEEIREAVVKLLKKAELISI